MDIPVAKVRKVLKIAQEPISLETPIGEREIRILRLHRDRNSSRRRGVDNLTSGKTESVLKTLTPVSEKVIKICSGVVTAASTRR